MNEDSLPDFADQLKTLHLNRRDFLQLLGLFGIVGTLPHVFLTACAAPQASAPVVATVNPSISNEEIKFTVKTKELKGILTHPASKPPYPAIILLQGSDRGSIKDPYYTEHAEKLVPSGFAVLRYDGPGVTSETLEYRTEEAIAAVKYLQSRPDIKSNAIGLWGISQGGWICQMAAASSADVAFIIPVSGPGVTPAEQEVYRVDAESRAAGFGEDEVAKAVLMRRLMVDLVLIKPVYQTVNLTESRRLGDGPWSEMTELAYSASPSAPAAQYAKIIEILKSIKDERWSKFLHLEQVLPMLASVPPQAWEMVKGQLRAVMEVDPANFLNKVHCPVLAIFGENDTSVPVDKSVTLYKQYLGEASNRAVTIKVFPKANHNIRVGETFAPGYFDLMVNWLRQLPAL